MPMPMVSVDTVSAGLVGDALQVDHYARLVMSIHASWPGRITEKPPGPDTISCQSSVTTVIR